MFFTVEQNWRCPAGFQLVSSWRSQNVWVDDYTEEEKKKPSALPYLSRRRMDKYRGKVHWAALIRDNHIPYFQVMPHLIADVSRYWLSVFWKPATEPCREFSKCGGSSKCTENSELNLTTSMSYSHEWFMCLRAECNIEGTLCFQTLMFILPQNCSFSLFYSYWAAWHSANIPSTLKTLLPLWMPLHPPTPTLGNS